jgi:uncharacterized protein (DUF58 family)
VPSRRGWLLLLGALLLGGAGRVLGLLELYALAAAALGLVASAVVSVRRPVGVTATRELRPPRVHAGNSSRVELTLRNTGRRRTGPLTAVDPFGEREARFLVPPLAANAKRSGAYLLPAEKRGVYSLGPLALERADPFGLAQAATEVAPQAELTVYPRVDDVVPLPYTMGQDPLSGSDHPTTLGPSGDELYALRAYEIGDDLRRVHWKSTAKLGELMIRQDEMPWQGRATVVLDLRSAVHTVDSLELCISAAASVITASWHHRALLRLVTTAGFDSGFGSGAGHAEGILERLAVVGADDGSLGGVLGGLRRGVTSGALAVVTTDRAGDADLAAPGRLGGRFGHVSVVVFERTAYDRWAAAQDRGARKPATRNAAGSAKLVRVTADDDFRSAWNRSMATRRAGAR